MVYLLEVRPHFRVCKLECHCPRRPSTNLKVCVGSRCIAKADPVNHYSYSPVSQKDEPVREPIPHSLGDRRPTSTKMRPRLVGHLGPRRGHSSGQTTTLVRKHSVGYSTSPLPSQSSTPVPSQSSDPPLVQSSGQGHPVSVPPSECFWRVSSFDSHNHTGRLITGSSISAENLATYVQIMEDSRAKFQSKTTPATGPDISRTLSRPGKSHAASNGKFNRGGQR